MTGPGLPGLFAFSSDGQQKSLAMASAQSPGGSSNPSPDGSGIFPVFYMKQGEHGIYVFC